MELSASANKATEAFDRCNNSLGAAATSDKPAVSWPLLPMATSLSIGVNVSIALDTPVEAPDLTGLVSKLDERPFFSSHYSNVYVGKYEDRKVAIKVLCKIESDDVTDRKFRRERYIWWRLRHPNVLRLHGFLEHDDGIEVSHTLVSEWAEGGNAADYIKQDLDWNQRTNLLYDVVKGLEYLHALEPSVVHGDLKPLNVLIGKDGVGQLCDFGLARLLKAQSGSGMTTKTPHTGTVRYLAYELVKIERALPTKATDMHALGCLALEIIYKILPYSNVDNQWMIPHAIAEGVPPAERLIDSDDAPDFWNLISACWSTDPGRRPTAEVFSLYLGQNIRWLSKALETPHKGPLEPSSDTIITPFRDPSAATLPPSPPPVVQSPTLSHQSSQHTSYEPQQLPPLEEPDIVQSDCIDEEADKEPRPFYRRAYRLVVDSCARLGVKPSSSGLPNQILSNRIMWPARLRFHWGLRRIS